MALWASTFGRQCKLHKPSIPKGRFFLGWLGVQPKTPDQFRSTELVLIAHLGQVALVQVLFGRDRISEKEGTRSDETLPIPIDVATKKGPEAPTHSVTGGRSDGCSAMATLSPTTTRRYRETTLP